MKNLPKFLGIAAFLLAPVCFAAAEDPGEINHPWLHNSAEEQLPFAESGDPIAQYLMSSFYATGEGGVEKDLVVAVEWLKKSAAQKYPRAQLTYAGMLAKGAGESGRLVKRDELRAVRILEALSGGGEGGREANVIAGQAAMWLGAIYAMGGDEIGKNPEKSYIWYERAAQLENSEAQYLLGIAFSGEEWGLDLDENPQKAAEWWQKSAALGYAAAQYALGWAYNTGYGVKQDKQEAIKWWKISASQGNKDSINALKKVLEE